MTYYQGLLELSVLIYFVLDSVHGILAATSKIASSVAHTWVMDYVLLQRSLHMYLINVVSCHHRKFGYI